MLRRVEPVAPDSVIGRNTVASIQSGLVWGFVAQVEGMVKRMVDELGGQARVVATGGAGAPGAGPAHPLQTPPPPPPPRWFFLFFSPKTPRGGAVKNPHKNDA